MENAQSIIFLPDISGFTHFTQQTEIFHSKHIISELLEVIINSNQLNLKVAEIEGDAVFFYKENYIPTAGDLIEQVRELPTRVHPLKFKNPVRYEGIINATKEEVYEIASNLEYRTSINRDASDFKYEMDRVNRVGFVHECVINNRNYSVETIANDFGDNKLVYGELLKKVGIARKMYSYIIFEDHGSGTKVCYEVHLKPIPIITRFFSPILRPFMRSKLKKSFDQLMDYFEDIE
jgi:hypothetical protein